jgi:hypothetical protein
VQKRDGGFAHFLLFLTENFVAGDGSRNVVSFFSFLLSRCLVVHNHLINCSFYQNNSASGSSTVAIDNKIEQAMDLVKSHLMFAVREEVEVLKERIDVLMERIAFLESENQILRAAATQVRVNTQTRNGFAPSLTANSQASVVKALYAYVILPFVFLYRFFSFIKQQETLAQIAQLEATFPVSGNDTIGGGGSVSVVGVASSIGAIVNNTITSTTTTPSTTTSCTSSQLPSGTSPAP